MRLSPFSGHTIHRLHSSRVPFGRLHGQRPRQSGFSNRSDLAEMALNLSMLVSVQQPERSSDSRGSKAISRTQSYASPEYWHGRGDGVTIEYSSASVINALRDMATSSRREAHRLGDRFGGGDNNHFFFGSMSARGSDTSHCRIGKWPARSRHTPATIWLRIKGLSGGSLIAFLAMSPLVAMDATQLQAEFTLLCLLEELEFRRQRVNNGGVSCDLSSQDGFI